MKEYIAETGGRYTYSDDILNLQELALSLTALFSECSEFIISGCLPDGTSITPGYVWIGGKIRYFNGATDVRYPYYIYESNRTEPVVYANEVNKRGRYCYLCSSGTSLPTEQDPLTGQLPGFIELRAEYTPRLADKFFGRYALQLESPTQRQRVKKDVTFAGEVLVEKGVKSSKELTVQNSNGYSVRTKIKEGGGVSLGAYLNELLTSEIILDTEGSFRFMKGTAELARFGSSGFSCHVLQAERAAIGAVYIYQGHIINLTDNTDEGAVNINHTGYNQHTSYFRNFNVYDGKGCSVPLFRVEGRTRTATVNGMFRISSTDACCVLQNSVYTKSDATLTAFAEWQDKDGVKLASVGFISNTTQDFTVSNQLGNIVFSPGFYVNVEGDLKLRGSDVYSVFVTRTDYNTGMGNKVDKVSGKQLSSEDFTALLRQKLEDISGSSLESGGDGYVTASDVAEALKLKLSANENLRDVMDKGAARTHIDVHSKSEADGRYLRISNKLLELVSLTAEEVNGLTAEEAAARKAEKQAGVRAVIDAEKRGTGDLKLTKASNLSDLPNLILARRNLCVYSTSEIDEMMAGKLGNDDAYTGIVFTEEMKQKLDGIKTGNFAYIDNFGVSQAQAEGYVLISGLVKELKKYAPRLLDGYSPSEKDSVAANIGVYTKGVADVRFAQVGQLFQDYITFLVKEGKTTAQAQEALRAKFDVFSRKEITDTYLRKDSNLSDLSLGNTDAKRLACRNLGAAYADDYQTKLTDTGWLQMNNSGSGTDTRQLFIRQIGNIVSIQGIINTAKRDGSNWGGVVAVIPNQIQPPKYGLRTTLANWDDDTKYNRGSSYIIRGNSRTIQIYESGMYNVSTEINFTYFV